MPLGQDFNAGPMTNLRFAAGENRGIPRHRREIRPRASETGI
jgi:hypothetical protein